MSTDQKKPAMTEGGLPELRSSRPRFSPFLDYIRYSEFKRLLGQLSAMIERDNTKVVAIISEHPLEGKTFFVSALALGYAVLLAKRVLVVNTVGQVTNASLYIKTVYENQLESASPFIGKKAKNRMIDLVSPLQHESTSATDTADFQIGGYIDSVKDHYDLVLLDTCALSVNNKNNMDPVVIARQADISILLISDRSLNRESLNATREKLSQWNVRLLGTIFNSGIRTPRARK